MYYDQDFEFGNCTQSKGFQFFEQPPPHCYVVCVTTKEFNMVQIELIPFFAKNVPNIGSCLNGYTWSLLAQSLELYGPAPRIFVFCTIHDLAT